jgi:hypothetical protein
MSYLLVTTRVLQGGPCALLSVFLRKHSLLHTALPPVRPTNPTSFFAGLYCVDVDGEQRLAAELSTNCYTGQHIPAGMLAFALEPVPPPSN